MMRMPDRSSFFRLAAAIAMLGCLAPAAQGQEYRPVFQLDQLKGPPVGAPNEVLVLGSPHLSGLSDSFRPTCWPRCSTAIPYS